MRPEQKPGFSGFTGLLAKTDYYSGAREPRCLPLALLVNRSGRFSVGSLAFLLLFGSLAERGKGEDKNPLTKEPRSVVLDKHGGSCVFSPDGKTLVSLGEEQTGKDRFGIPKSSGIVKIWDVASRKSRVFLKWDQVIGSVAFSPDGNLLVGSTNEPGKDALEPTDPFVILWKAKTGERVAVLKKVGGGVFSPDSKILATGNSFDMGRCRVQLWELPSGKLRRILEVGTKSIVYCIQFSPDGKSLALGGAVPDPEKRENVRDERSLLKLWDVATGKELAEYKELKGPIYSVAFSPDGKLLAIGGNIGKEINEIILWDVAKKERRSALTGHLGLVMHLAFSHDGKLLASAGGSRRDGELRLWNLKTLREVASLKGHTDAVTQVSFSPDDSMLTSGSRDGTIRLWYLREPQPVKDKRER